MTTRAATPREVWLAKLSASHRGPARRYHKPTVAKGAKLPKLNKGVFR